jgi:hypothetical protein
METLWQFFISCVGEFDSVFIVLDAFDECEDNHHKILSLVQGFVTQPSVRVLVSGRPQVVQTLRDISTASDILVISADDGDVRTYLSSILDKQQYLISDLRKEVIDVISRESEGM